MTTAPNPIQDLAEAVEHQLSRTDQRFYTFRNAMIGVVVVLATVVGLLAAMVLHKTEPAADPCRDATRAAESLNYAWHVWTDTKNSGNEDNMRRAARTVDAAQTSFLTLADACLGDNQSGSVPKYLNVVLTSSGTEGITNGLDH